MIEVGFLHCLVSFEVEVSSSSTLAFLCICLKCWFVGTFMSESESLFAVVISLCWNWVARVSFPASVEVLHTGVLSVCPVIFLKASF